jgi:hypothetical protein
VTFFVSFLFVSEMGIFLVSTKVQFDTQFAGLIE